MLQSAALASLLSFTRASLAYDFTEAGLLVPAAVNEARRGADPVTGARQGWLFEGGVTNSILNSAGGAATWLDSATNTQTGELAPDGALSWRGTSTITGGANNAYVEKSATVPNDAVMRTFSVFLRKGTSPLSTVNMFYLGGTYISVFGTVTWGATPTATPTFSGGFSGVHVGNGWWRCSVSLANNNSGNTQVYCRIYVRDYLSANVAGHSVEHWGWQREDGPGPTSYMPTTSAPVARAADLANISGAAFTAAFPQQSVTNMLPRSQELDQGGVWFLNAATVSANTAATTAPDGSNTADLLSDTATNTIHYTQGSPVGLVPGTIITGSIYAKAGGLSVLQIGIDESSLNGAHANFDLTNGTVSHGPFTRGNGNAFSASISSVGNGWYRCQLTCECGAGQTALRMAMVLQNVLQANWAGPYLGTGAGMYLWGMQIEAVPLNPSPNLLALPETLEAWSWTKQGVTVVANVITPCPDSTLSPDKLCTDGAAGQHYLQSAVITAVAGAPYTASIFAKKADFGTLSLGFTGGGLADSGITFDLLSGVSSVPFGSAVTTTAASLGNGWWRFSITLTPTAAAAFAARFFLPSGTATVGFGTYCWGGQLIQAAAPAAYVSQAALLSSYVPTLAAPATRTGPLAGAFFCDLVLPAAAPAGGAGFALFVFNDGAGLSRLNVVVPPNTGVLYLYASGANVPTGPATGVTVAYTPGVPFRLGVRWGRTALGNLQVFMSKDGGAVLATLQSVPAGMNRVEIGSYSDGSASCNARFRAVRTLAFAPDDARFAACTVLGADIDALLAA